MVLSHSVERSYSHVQGFSNMQTVSSDLMQKEVICLSRSSLLYMSFYPA